MSELNVNKYNEFLFNHCIKNKNLASHNSKYYNNSYLINDDEIDTFYDLYINAFQNNQELYIIETTKEYIPIIIDIDIKYLISEKINDRIYLPILDKFIKILIKYINKYLIVNDDNFLLFLFEKKYPWEKNNILKDGIHIMAPFIWIPYELIFIIRNDIIKDPEYIKLFDLIPHTNDIEDIYDKSPYINKLWLMHQSYDSFKNKLPYNLTKIYNKNLQLQPFNYTKEELIKLLGIRIIKKEYIAKTKLSIIEILNMYNVLDIKIILGVFLRDAISDETNFNYKNLFTHTYYNINDINKFYRYLYDSLNNGNDEYITQKTKEYGPIIVDLDLYYDDDDDTITKIYSLEFIKIICEIYINLVKKYVITDEKNIQIFVLEKNEPYFNGELYKDGLHLIMPFICLTKENQKIIRLEAIKEIAKLNIIDNSLLKRVFDPHVIDNTWTVYGCKNQNQNLYLLTKIYDSNLNSIDITQYSLKDLIDILNITKFSEDEINQLKIENYNNIELFNNLLSTTNYTRYKLYTIFFIILLFVLIILKYR